MRLPKFVAALSMTAVLACGMVAIPQTATAQEDKATACAQELNIKGPSTEKTGEVPALLVHGHDGEPDTWTEPEHSMKRALDPTEKLVVVPPFDYHDESTKWVANSDAAHRLAKTIVCYYLLYGEKVVVGAHSMGGLLAYEAFDWAAYGVYAKDAVGHLVTIGSPFKGTILATLGFEGIVALCRLMGMTPRGQRPMEELCREANSDKSISGLSYDSDQLEALPHLPKGITHKAIAGRIQMKFCLIKCIPFSVGDGVVPSDSATARYTDTGVGDGKTIFDCTISEGGWCEHGSMLQTPKVQKEVKKSIEAHLASRQPKCLSEWDAQAILIKDLAEDGDDSIDLSRLDELIEERMEDFPLAIFCYDVWATGKLTSGGDGINLYKWNGSEWKILGMGSYWKGDHPDLCAKVPRPIFEQLYC